jgi:large subunit ribosomal protein L10
MSAALQTPVSHERASLVAKRSRVEELTKELASHRVAGIVAFRGVPASALQSMRRELRGHNNRLRIAPNSLLTHALARAAEEKPTLQELIPLVHDQCGLLLSETNPFGLYHALEQTRQPTFARGGEIAPQDVLVPAGETSFKPGPIVGELQHVGLPAAIEKGKVVIKKDTVIVHQGQTIPREVAQMLTRLEVKPLVVGLVLQGAVEEDFYYPRDALAVDLDQRRADVARAHSQALALATRLGWISPETLPRLLTRAHREALGLAIAGAYPTPETLSQLLRKAYQEALALEALKRN